MIALSYLRSDNVENIEVQKIMFNVKKIRMIERRMSSNKIVERYGYFNDKGEALLHSVLVVDQTGKSKLVTIRFSKDKEEAKNNFKEF